MKFFRLRLLISLMELLRCCLRVSTPNGSQFPTLIRYERLPTFCFFCGKIGHRYHVFFMNLGIVFVSDMEYGPWLVGIDYIASYLLEWIENPNQSPPMVASFTKSGHTSDFSGMTEPKRSFQGNPVDNGDTKAIIPYTGG